MKRLRKAFALWMVISFVFTLSLPVFAATAIQNATNISKDSDGVSFSLNGNSYYGETDPDDTDGMVRLTIGGTPYWFDSSDASEIKDADKNATSLKLSDKDQKTLDGIAANAREEVGNISKKMEGIKPDLGAGATFLSGLNGGYQTILSCILWIGWAFFMGTEIFNGIVVCVPGLYDLIAGEEAANSGYGYGMGGGTKKKGLLAKFLSKNTRNVMGKQGGGMGMGMNGGQDDGEEPVKLWFKGEIVRIVAFVIIAICLFNGLIFKLMDFALGVFHFGD